MPDTPADALVHTSFYQFADLSDPDAVVAIVRELVEPLTGSVLVAREGISGALAASPRSPPAPINPCPGFGPTPITTSNR